MTFEATAIAYQADLPPVKKLILIGCADSTGDCPPPKLASVAQFAGIEVGWAATLVAELIRDGHLDKDLRVVGARFTEDDSIPCGGRVYAKRKLPRALRQMVLDRDGHRCQVCGVESDLTIDHIKAEVLGGSDDPENLQVLCRRCNGRKGTKETVPPLEPAEIAGRP